MTLELRAIGTGVVRRDVHSLGKHLELVSGVVHLCVLSETHISPSRQICRLASLGAREETGAMCCQ